MQYLDPRKLAVEIHGAFARELLALMSEMAVSLPGTLISNLLINRLASRSTYRNITPVGIITREETCTLYS